MKKIKELFKKQSKKILFFWITLGTLVTTSIAGIISIITILTKKSKTNFSNFSEDKKLNNSDKDYLTTLPLDENPKGVQNLDKNLSEKNLLNTKSLAKKSDDENISISKDLGKINPSIKTGNDKKILENKNQNPSIFVKTPNNNSLNNKNQTDTSSDLNILKNENKDQNSEVLNKDNNYLNDKNINKSINSDKKTEKNKKNTEQFSKTSLENTISTVEDKQNSKIKNQKDVTFEKTKKTLIPESKPKEDEIEKIDDSNIDYESKSEQPINDIN
ncbi:hypothetical protein, partial [Mycoplasmopsis cricetuli]|uniref:hypothetical protein n=1 Tax=Mycoplasmopsis cricetuli TaxID=171283 RepID=UPI00046FF5C0